MTSIKQSVCFFLVTAGMIMSAGYAVGRITSAHASDKMDVAEETHATEKVDIAEQSFAGQNTPARATSDTPDINRINQAINSAKHGNLPAESVQPSWTPEALRTWGNAKADVSVYLFSSLTCPHCMVFHEEVLPKLKETFVQTGKVKLIYVDMPYDAKALTGTLLTRCISPALYEKYITALFQNQTVWAYTSNPRKLMDSYATALGADTKAMRACVSDMNLRKKVIEQRDNLSTLYKVRGMPTVVVVKNGEATKITGTDTPVILAKIKSVLGEE